MHDDARTQAQTKIHHLISVYNNAGDRGRIEEMVGVFAKGGVLEVDGISYTGMPAIRDFLGGVADGTAAVDLRGSRHHLTTSRIEFESEDAALGWTYFLVMRGATIIQNGMYTDRFARQGGRWVLVHRRVKYERIA